MDRQQKERIEKIRVLNEDVRKGQILFTGSSLMEQFPVNELLMTENLNCVIYNRGVGGFTTEDMLQYMNEMVFDVEPLTIFINIGTNDLNEKDFSEKKLLDNYQCILEQIKEKLPETKVYVMAYYPINETDKLEEWGLPKGAFGSRSNVMLKHVNERIRELAEKENLEYIDVNEGLTDERGFLKKEYTVEGIHMYANAYRKIFNNMKKYLC